MCACLHDACTHDACMQDVGTYEACTYDACMCDACKKWGQTDGRKAEFILYYIILWSRCDIPGLPHVNYGHGAGQYDKWHRIAG